MSTFDSYGTQAAANRNKKLEQQRSMLNVSERIADPIRDLHETMKDIKSLLAELLFEIRNKKDVG